MSDWIYDDEEASEMKELLLTRIKLASRIEISDECLHDIRENATLKCYKVADLFGDRLVATMYSYILGCGEKSIQASWPANWWQAVKDRFAPVWVLRWWPVEYHTIKERQFENVYLSVFQNQASKYPDGAQMVVDEGGFLAAPGSKSAP